MRAIILAALVALNLAVLDAIIRLSRDGPDISEAEDAPVTPRATSLPQLTNGADIATDLSPGRVMFGLGTMKIGSASDAHPALEQPPSVSYRLVGILLVQNLDGRHSANVLIRHGSPPIVTKYPIGGQVDEWVIRSVARTSAELVKPDGTTFVLQVDRTNE